MDSVANITGMHAAPPTSAAVVCRAVAKSFGTGEARVQALRGVDLVVETGQLTLLVGPSGCGKTTLISTIAGLLDPTSGEIEVLGQKLDRLSSGRLVDFRRMHIGFVFQQLNLLPALTAAENAAVSLLASGQRRGPAVRAAANILDTLGLGARCDALPGELSVGQQQRVAIARALVHNPRLLVCDEPTSALDAESGQTVMELLLRVAVQAERAVIVVTHDTRVLAFGDRIIHMLDGRVARVESPAIPAAGGPT